jgi:hypothetical protein
MSLIKQNQNKLWAIFASVLFHLLLLLFMMLESKQQIASTDTIPPEILLQLDNLEQLLDEPMPVLADNKGEKAVSTNLKSNADQTKLEEVKPLPEQFFATEKIDSVEISHAKATVEALMPPPPPPAQDTVAKDLKQAIQKSDSMRAKRAQLFADIEFVKKNFKTIQSLRKVFAFAKKAREMKEHLDKELSTIHNSSERRKAIKRMEKEVWASFEYEARRMSTSQGKLLLKLLARETGQTGYAIVKEYKGALPAIFWQGVAQMFHQNLKSSYDSLGEDALLEQIVKKYEKKEIK